MTPSFSLSLGMKRYVFIIANRKIMKYRFTRSQIFYSANVLLAPCAAIEASEYENRYFLNLNLPYPTAYRMYL